MSVRPTIRLSAMKQLISHWMDFCEIWYLSIFRKSVEDPSFIKIGQE
jgi:hypothetical protein